MSADYSKACDHEETQSTKHGTYCTRCGTRIIDTGELGPVRLPTYDEMMRDARQANWRPIASAPVRKGVDGTLDVATRTIYVARRRYSDGRWTTIRLAKGCSLPHRVSHWSEDVLGLPACRD